MVIINNKGYLEVRNQGNTNPNCKSTYRNFWIGRQVISLRDVHIPKKYWGKRVRFKVEVVDND